ncbi:BREX-1 system adenine-specific DNA-methyltransferase PglX [Mesorhizobium sp. CO1-1-7]|uniref:BREX-1 system adenine-specific DNA-methyltransferase PglX n=1 Tax=Mesorhizobium sp. CO1-1-7 TaxID=2876632 RepID=UPI001CD06FB2|nr:BREX-1 system adenine-specific DNA-methyltransferase PglX [Mesorhizobium sp. CO1-1-7]MBZ9746806.1 BREX-1 system adenine-specific DNA-methyltransferase PglX [Mesorhizobium sp. CO1-1-7]
MTTFLRLLADKDKGSNLLASCTALRANADEARVFQVAPESFRTVPGAPFAYWVSEAVREVFERLPALECDKRTARQGLATADDFRFVRAAWEVEGSHEGWWGFAKGGAFSPYYSDIYLVANWSDDGKEMKAWADPLYGNSGWSRILKSTDCYARPGLTWPRRTQGGLSLRAMPRGCIFADKGPAAFVANDAPDALLALLAMVNSQAFRLLVSLQMAFGSYEVGVIQKTPVPDLTADQEATLSLLARRIWSLKRTLNTIEETSHAFVLPAALRARAGNYDPRAIEAELLCIQAEIDAMAYDLYGFSEADRTATMKGHGATMEKTAGDIEAADDDVEDEDSATPIDQTTGLLSWAVGVAFGRFDLRLATGERPAPPEPHPFDPLPAKSSGMLPGGAEPFYTHPGILVDDPGHPHDLARLVEEVLTRVEAAVPSDVRRWLQRDFFSFHLQRYSRSRRKAPIYWPLSTTSASYTLWLYYPSLTSQTLYTAVNDFIEPKLKQVGQDVAALRNKGSARTRDDEKSFEALQVLDLELVELRDTLLQIAPTYRPNHGDGVQITAAPLWQLFRQKPWHKVLKDTWAKLEKDDYDWSHLAMAYWPDRVREKCKTDKSLAIAHDLEHLHVEAKPAANKRSLQNGGGL